MICDKVAPLELDKLQYFYAHIKVQLDCLIWGKRPSVCILEIICIIDFQTSLKEIGIYHPNCDRQNVCPCYFIKIMVIVLWIPDILSCPQFFFNLCMWEMDPSSSASILTSYRGELSRKIVELEATNTWVIRDLMSLAT